MALPGDSEYRPRFIVGHEAWYAAANGMSRDGKAQISVGLYSGEDGTLSQRWGSEFTFRWRDLGDGKRGCRLEAFDDAWKTLLLLGAVLRPVLELEDPSPDEVKAALTEAGFEDVTDREQPGVLRRALPQRQGEW